MKWAGDCEREIMYSGNLHNVKPALRESPPVTVAHTKKTKSNGTSKIYERKGDVKRKL